MNTARSFTASIRKSRKRPWTPTHASVNDEMLREDEKLVGPAGLELATNGL